MTAPSPKVEQRHRDAAADYGLHILFSELGAERVREGLGDNDGLVQAFAAFESDILTPSGESREAALVAAVRDALAELGLPTGYFSDIGAPKTRALQAAFQAYEEHPSHARR